MKKKRQALLASVTALVLCFTMLLGTTFAWFTSTASIENNIIKTGKLKVTLEYKDYSAAVDAGWNDGTKGAIFTYDNWEPGYTSIKHVRLGNVGTLAFKYRLDIVPTDTTATADTANLADVIEVYLVTGEVKNITRESLKAYYVGTLSELMVDPDGAAYGILLPNEAKANYETYTIALKMSEGAGNEYQELDVNGSFAVQLHATQYTHESDSLGNDYDANATYDGTADDSTKPTVCNHVDANHDGTCDLGCGKTDIAVTHVYTASYTDNADNATHKSNCSCGAFVNEAHVYESGLCKFCGATEPVVTPDDATSGTITFTYDAKTNWGELGWFANLTGKEIDTSYDSIVLTTGDNIRFIVTYNDLNGNWVQDTNAFGTTQTVDISEIKDNKFKIVVKCEAGTYSINWEYANTTEGGDVTPPCEHADANHDGTCDNAGCGATGLTVNHSYNYTPNNDGTHNGVCSCDATDNGTCDTNGTDGACSKCGYKATVETPDDHVHVPGVAYDDTYHWNVVCTDETCDQYNVVDGEQEEHPWSAWIINEHTHERAPCSCGYVKELGHIYNEDGECTSCGATVPEGYTVLYSGSKKFDCGFGGTVVNEGEKIVVVISGELDDSTLAGSADVAPYTSANYNTASSIAKQYMTINPTEEVFTYVYEFVVNDLTAEIVRIQNVTNITATNRFKVTVFKVPVDTNPSAGTLVNLYNASLDGKSNTQVAVSNVDFALNNTYIVRVVGTDNGSGYRVALSNGAGSSFASSEISRATTDRTSGKFVDYITINYSATNQNTDTPVGVVIMAPVGGQSFASGFYCDSVAVVKVTDEVTLDTFKAYYAEADAAWLAE